MKISVGKNVCVFRRLALREMIIRRSQEIGSKYGQQQKVFTVVAALIQLFLIPESMVVILEPQYDH